MLGILDHALEDKTWLQQTCASVQGQCGNVRVLLKSLLLVLGFPGPLSWLKSATSHLSLCFFPTEVCVDSCVVLEVLMKS